MRDLIIIRLCPIYLLNKINQPFVTLQYIIGRYILMSHGGLVDTGLCQSHGSFGDTDLSIGGGMGDTD